MNNGFKDVWGWVRWSIQIAFIGGIGYGMTSFVTVKTFNERMSILEAKSTGFIQREEYEKRHADLQMDYKTIISKIDNLSVGVTQAIEQNKEHATMMLEIYKLQERIRTLEINCAKSGGKS